MYAEKVAELNKVFSPIAQRVEEHRQRPQAIQASIRALAIVMALVLTVATVAVALSRLPPNMSTYARPLVSALQPLLTRLQPLATFLYHMALVVWLVLVELLRWGRALVRWGWRNLKGVKGLLIGGRRGVEGEGERWGGRGKGKRLGGESLLRRINNKR